MSAFRQTSSGTEGAEDSSQLTEFFAQNNKLKLEWYNKLVEVGFDYDDLMDSAEKDLRNTLTEDCKLPSFGINRIMNAVRKTPESVMYTLLHGTKVSIVSTEEHEATEQIQKESARISQAITNITHIMAKLTENSQSCEESINNVFDDIITNANDRRDILLTQLKDITYDKYNQLLNQQNVFKKKVQQLSYAYDETQNMMKDTTMDSSKRKNKILSDTKQLLKVNINLSPKTNEKIKVDLNVTDFNNSLAQIGFVCDGFGALSPFIQVTEVKYDRATILINTNVEEKECIGHRLEYIENNDDNKEDEKLDWTSINVQNKNNNKSEYEIKDLNKATKYMVRAKSQNKNGWGAYSKTVTFKTNDVDQRQLTELRQMIIRQMIFDCNLSARQKKYIHIINDLEAKAISSGAYKTSLKLKYGMPVNKRVNNEHNISAISWTVKICGGRWTNNYWYFLGVVSNRTTKFIGAYYGLKDAYGISGNSPLVYQGNPENKYDDAAVVGIHYKDLLSNNDIIVVEYNITRSELLFHNKTQKKLIYTMQLPDAYDITHWYPCLSLRDKNDTCLVSNVTVKFM